MFTRGRCHRQENLHPPVHVYSSDADYSSIKVMSKKNFHEHCFLDIFQSFTNSFDLHFGLKRIPVGSRVEKMCLHSVVYTALNTGSIAITLIFAAAFDSLYHEVGEINQMAINSRDS